MKRENTIRLLQFCVIATCFAVSSCTNNSVPTPFSVGKPEFKQPVSRPLKFIPGKTIDLSKIKAISVNVTQDRFDYNGLPSRPYDTSGFVPFKAPVTETRFDYNALPSRSFDINRLTVRPIKFKTIILNPPALIKVNLFHIQTNDNGLYDARQIQELLGVTIRNLLVARNGFVWLVTDDGVYRYDGTNLLFYKLSITLNNGVRMIEDKDNRIWILVAQDDIKILDPKTGTMKLLKMPGKSGDLNIDLFQDEQQRVWITGTEGINIVDLKTQTTRLLDAAHGLLKDLQVRINKAPDNCLWVVTNNSGINIIDLKSNKIRYLTTAQGLSSNNIIATMLFDRQGRTWMTTLPGGGINLVDPKNHVIKYIKETEEANTGTAISRQDNEGNVWIAKTRNIRIIDPARNAIKTVYTLPGTNRNQNEFINFIKSDRSGQLWVGTNIGHYLLNRYSVLNDQVGKESVSCLLEDKNGLVWEGNLPGAIDILDRKARTAKHFSKKYGLVSDSIQFFNEINGKVFISTSGGLDIIDSSRKSISHLNNKNGLQGKIVNSVAMDGSGRIWIGEANGIDIFDPGTKTARHIDKTDGLSDNSITQLVTDHQGKIWINTNGGGVDIIDPKTYYIKRLGAEPGLKGQSRRELLCDDDGNIWVGTAKGLYFVDQVNKTITHFATQNGLISNLTNSVLAYKKHIYAGTKNGITVITPPGLDTGRKWRSVSFGKDNGIEKQNANVYLSDLITRDGLYWWGDFGIKVLNLSNSMAPDTPRTLLTGLNIMDEPAYFADWSNLNDTKQPDTLWTETDGLYYLKGQAPAVKGYAYQSRITKTTVRGPYNTPVNLSLPNNLNYLQFHFTRLSSETNDSTFYRYILEGRDKEWSEGNSATSSKNYFNLSPGKYTFKVASMGPNKEWTKPEEFAFVIRTPWWNAWWAYVLYVILLVGVVFIILELRSRNLLEQNKSLEARILMRTKELSEANNELESRQEEIITQRDQLSKTVTDLRATQDQLIQAEKMASMGELTAGIAHEIQNPLNFVNNFAELNLELMGELKEENEKTEPDKTVQEELIDSIVENTEKIRLHGARAESIVKSMLQHSRTTGSAKQPTNINKLAEEYLRLAYHGFRAKDKSFYADLVARFDEKLPEVTIVQQDIGRVLLNVFNNAFYAVHQKQMADGENYRPTVEVSTAKVNNYIELKIKDNGAGIPENIKDKIMQPFFTTKPTGQGTGLGLSLSYDIVVKGHGGSMSVNSAPGAGAEFVIQLFIS